MLLRLLPAFLLIVSLLYHIQAQTSLTPISGADGEFTIMSVNGNQVFQSNGSSDNYQPYIYLRSSENVQNQNVFVELTFLDIGYGPIKIDYNSTTSNYQQTEGKNSFLLDQKGIKKMIFKLNNAHFKKSQNLGADLRIWSDTKVQKHLISAILYFQPTELWSQYNENYFGEYTGRKLSDDKNIDNSTLYGKVICGYQGWFRAPGDPDGKGWVHYFRDNNISKPTIEMWPYMEEYTSAEHYPVPNWKTNDGKNATVFSSANKKTVLRHFQWMQAYGIHGVAVQRFVSGLYPGHDHDSYRVLSYCREAANRTGRTFYVMYDQSGMSPSQMVDYIKRDWKILVDSMKITFDNRYLHHDGKPIVSIFGYWPERFSIQDAKALADIFKQPGYQAHIIGSGAWVLNSNPEWNTIYDDMVAYFPWNVGHYTSPDLNSAFVATQQWQSEKNILQKHDVLFMPLVFPGFAWDNLMNEPPGTTNFGRRKGTVMWKQIQDARNIGAKSLYIAMFDEIDEGTAIFKISNNIPVNHYFLGNENLPPDFYLTLTGWASDVFSGAKPMPTAMPDFAKLSQPSIPELLFPGHNDTLYSGQALQWHQAFHQSGIVEYEIKINEKIYSTTDLRTFSFPFQSGTASYSVALRAKNGLGNYGGWSETNQFYYVNNTSATKNISLKHDILIFPNPNDGILHFYPQNLRNSICKIHIFGIDGKTIFSGSINIVEHPVLDIRQYLHQPTIAFVVIQMDEFITIKKMIFR